MKIFTALLIILFVFVLIFIGTIPSANVVSAAPNAQFVTATPGQDGRILYMVAEGDNCSIVAFNHGITVPQLRALNTRLDENCTLTVGQQVVVGIVVSDAPTAGPGPTLPSVTATTTPVSGTTEVCVLLFDDTNGDALRQETEFGIEGGAVSLTNLNGSYSQTQNTTSAIDPDLVAPIRSCFTDVPQGEYNVSVAVPDTYNPTMLLSYTLTVRAGDRASIDFGAQSKTLTVSNTTDSEQGGRSSVLGIFGLLLLLSGAGLGYYAYRSGQPKSKLKGSPLTKR